MKVKRTSYKKKGTPVNVNIRLQMVGEKPTRQQMIDTLRAVRATGRVPKGWRLAAIDWQNPRWASEGWQTGDLGDMMGSLGPVIDVLLDQNKMRVGIVRKVGE